MSSASFATSVIKFLQAAIFAGLEQRLINLQLAYDHDPVAGLDTLKVNFAAFPVIMDALL